jgi:hypothetical protein
VPGRVITAQAMRASLFSRATTISFECMRAPNESATRRGDLAGRSRCNTHALAPWISRHRTYGFPRLLIPRRLTCRGRILFRDQPEPCPQVARSTACRSCELARQPGYRGRRIRPGDQSSNAGCRTDYGLAVDSGREAFNPGSPTKTLTSSASTARTARRSFNLPKAPTHCCAHKQQMPADDCGHLLFHCRQTRALRAPIASSYGGNEQPRVPGHPSSGEPNCPALALL